MTAGEAATGGSGQGRKPTLRERVEALSYINEIRSRLTRGESLTSTVRLVHGRGDLTDVGEVRLVAALDRIRMKLPRAPAVSLAVGVARTPAEGRQALQDLVWLYEQQVQRIRLDRRLERKIKKSLPSVGRQMQVALQIQQAILQAKLDLGLIRKTLPEYGAVPPPPAHSLAHLPIPKDPAAPARVRQILQHFHALAQQRMADLQGGAALAPPGDGDPAAGGPEGAAGPRDPAGDPGGSTET